MRTFLITILTLFTLSTVAHANPWAFERHVGDNAEVNRSTIEHYKREIRERAAALTQRLNRLRESAVRRSLRGDNRGWYDYAREYARISNLRGPVGGLN